MTTTRKYRLAATAALAVVACGVTACTNADPAADTAHLVLRIGTDDGDDTPAADQIQHFADQVDQRSSGAITIEPAWHAAGMGVPHWDQEIAKLVTSGGLDLAMVPSRAWDDLGVDSLRAINAPFLMTSDSLVEEVVTDDQLVEQLTSDLPAVGAEALALYPEGLRHPFGFDRPLRGAEDYEGGVVRTGWSRTANAMFEALGASITDDQADPTTMIGAESSYRLTPAGIATGNVVFYPKVNVLTARGDLADDLTEEQYSVLQDAAAATTMWVLNALPTDAESAMTYCSEAGKISAASQAEIDSLVAATRGVVEELRADETTAAIIDTVEQLKQGYPDPERLTSCPDVADDHAAALNGVYQFTVTAKAARAAGVADPGTIEENTGDITVTFDDGEWLMDQVYAIGPNAGKQWHGTGGYTFDGKHFQFFWDHEPGEWTKAVVEIAKDGSLVFRSIKDGGDAQALALSEAWFTSWPRKDN